MVVCSHNKYTQEEFSLKKPYWTYNEEKILDIEPRKKTRDPKFITIQEEQQKDTQDKIS